MDRPQRGYSLRLLLALALIALPACNDSEPQRTGALTPIDPPVLLRVEDSPSALPVEPTPPFQPVVVPAVMPEADPVLQPTAGTTPVDPGENPDWWQSYLGGGGEPSSAGPELNAPLRETIPTGSPQRMPAPRAPHQQATPARGNIERFPAVQRHSPEDRTATQPRQPVQVAMATPPALPADPRDAFAPPRSTPVAPARPPAAEVELGMPASAPRQTPRADAPSQSAQPVIPNYSRPEYQPAARSEARRVPPSQAPQSQSSQVDRLPPAELALHPPQQAATRPTTAPAAPPVASQARPPQGGPTAGTAAGPIAGPRPEDPMRAVNQRADELIARGNALAARSAYYSARTDLVQALRLITQANDARLQTNIHSEALAAALRALRESDDFVPQGAAVEANLNLPQIISVHRTPVLKNVPAESLSSLVALQAYYTYAQEQLAVAAAGNPSASRAMYSLARLHSLLAETKPAEGAVLGPKALALHQAALMTDPTNYRAANELGVLLARYGQYNQARTVLLHGLSVETCPELWENLAAVYERQGETQLAARARDQAQVAARQPAPASDGNPIQWVAPEAFLGPPEGGPAIATQPAPRTAAPAPATAPRSARGSNGLTDWLPWERSR